MAEENINVPVEEVKTPTYEAPELPPVTEQAIDVPTPLKEAPLEEVKPPVKEPSVEQVNKKALNNLDVPIDKIPNGEETYKYLNKLKDNVLAGTPDFLKKKWDKKGKIGIVEAIEMKDKTYLVPHAGDIVEAIELAKIFSILRNAEDGKPLTESEYNLAGSYIQKQQEKAYRGYTRGGNISAGVVESAVFGVELATSFGLALPKKVAGKVAKKLAVEGIEKIAEGFVKQGIKKGLGKKIVSGVKKTAVKTVAKMPTLAVTKVPLASNAISLNDSIYLTDKGKTIFMESDEAPVKTAMRALGDVFIETFSEMAGGEIISPMIGSAKGAVKGFAKSLSPAFVEGFEKLVGSTFNMKASKALAKFGWNGILEEVGEERLGGLLRFITDLDPEDGWSVQQAIDNIFWGDLDSFITEMGIIGAGGTMSHALGGTMNVFAKLGMNKKDAEYLDETELDRIVKQSELKETEAEEKNFKKFKEFKKQEIIETGRPEIEAQHHVDVLDSFYSNIAKQQGKSRLDTVREAGEPMFRKTEDLPDTAFTEGQKYSQEGIIKTDTPQFKEWFGESKVVDKGGKPLVVYHGTGAKIKEFKESKIGTGAGTVLGKGFYFADNKAKAKEYGKNVFPLYLDIKNPYEVKYGDGLTKSIMNELGVTRKEIAKEFGEEKDDAGYPTDQAVQDFLKSKGFDGIKREGEYVVFNPKQIKSVDNKGTFSKETADIYEQDKRGAFDPVTNIIHLLKNADESTIEHELAHYFLETINKMSPEKMSDVMDFTGFKGQDFSSLNNTDKREAHERFAEMYEQYLREGVAPTKKLKRVFEDFKIWLRDIYKDLKKFRVPLNNNARKFFDRMLDADVVEDNRFMLGQDAIDALQEVIDGVEEGELKTIKINGNEYTYKEVLSLIGNSKLSSPKKGQELLTFIKKEGGINDSEGELINMDAPFGVRASKGTTPDMMSERLHEEGYIPEHNIDMMYEYINKSLMGDKKYSTAYSEEVVRGEETKRLIDESARILSTLKVPDNFKEQVLIAKRKSQKELKIETQSKLESFIKKLPVSDEVKLRLIGKVKHATTKAKLNKLVREIKLESKIEAGKERIRELAPKIHKEVMSTKTGVKTVGKYDYTTNDIFKELRDYANMNQGLAKQEYQKMAEAIAKVEDAELEVKPSSEIKLRFLRMKALGIRGSSALYESVYSDIMNLKRLGDMAKNEADYNQYIERTKLKNELISKFDSLHKGKRGWTRRKLSNWVGDLETLTNEFFGKELSDELSMISSESNMEVKLFENKEKNDKAVKEIFGVKNLKYKMMKLSKPVAKIKTLTEKGVAKDISTLEIIDIYNGMKNTLKKEQYINSYGEAQINKLTNKLSQKEKDYADYLVDFYKDYYFRLNKIYVKIYNKDLPMVENYVPSSSEYVKMEDIFNDYVGQAVNPTAFSKRSVSADVTPKPLNPYLAQEKYMAQSEHIINVGLKLKQLKEVFKDKDIRDRIEQIYGKETTKSLETKLEAMSLNGIQKAFDIVDKTYGRMLSNWTTAKIATNISVFAKQLISSVNFMTKMPSGSWMSGYVSGLTSPIKTFKFMMENPALKARLKKGNTDEIMRAMSDLEFGEGFADKLFYGIGVDLSKIKKGAIAPQRYGDIMAWVYGGYPYVKHLMKKGMTKEQAFEQLNVEGLKTQQSGLKAQLSNFQLQGNSFSRIFSGFKNTLAQYLRVLHNSMVQYKRGDISLSEVSKTWAVIGIANPIIFAMIGDFMRDGFWHIFTGADEDEEDKDMEEMLMWASSAVLSQSLGGVFFAGDVASTIVKGALGEDAYPKNIPVVSDILDASINKFSHEVDIDPYKMGLTVGELFTGLPLKTINKYGEKILEE